MRRISRVATGIAVSLALGTSLGQAQEFRMPSGLAITAEGMLILADRSAHYVFEIDPSTGETRVIAGTGEGGFSGDGGPALEAQLRNPEWVEVDTEGNIVLADRGNHRVRRIERGSGVITTLVGDGQNATLGDGGPARGASLTYPFGLVLDAHDNVFVFDTESHQIRRVDADSRVITRVVGSGEEGFDGDGPATEAAMFRPHNGRFDAEGRLVFGDSFNQRVRRWDPSTGLIETIAGSGEQGSVEDGTAWMEASFMYFGAMVFDSDGDLLFTSLDNRILRLDAESGTVRIEAGLVEGGYSGDGGPATQAQFNLPYGLARGVDGTLYVADANNSVVRAIDPDGVVRTISRGVTH